jgi:hypothetical protein
MSENAFTIVRKPSSCRFESSEKDGRNIIRTLFGLLCTVWGFPEREDIFETKVSFDRIANCQNVCVVGESVVFLENVPEDVLRFNMTSEIRRKFGQGLQVRHLSIEKNEEARGSTWFKGLYIIELNQKVWAYKIKEEALNYLNY